MALLGLPDQLRLARQRSGMTKADAARAVGVDLSLPTKWESGERQPQLDNLERVADVYKHRLIVLLVPQEAPTVEIRTTPLVARLAEAAGQLEPGDVQTLIDLATRLGGP